MEIWKDIAGYEGLYQVSNLGNVKSFCKKTPHILSPATDRNGYSSVCLHIDGKKRTCTIHRLVAKAFIPNPDNKRDVNHLNGVKTDNRVEKSGVGQIGRQPFMRARRR